MSVAFYIKQIKHITEFVNDSDFDVMISWKPVKPKRKVTDELLVQKKSRLIIEIPIDLKKIYLSFLGKYS